MNRIINQKLIVMKSKSSIFKNVNTYLHIVAGLSLFLVLACWAIEYYYTDYKCNILYLLQDIAYGYLGSYIVYAITVLLKNVRERQQNKSIIYRYVIELYRCVYEYVETECEYESKVGDWAVEDVDFSNLNKFINDAYDKINAFDRYLSILTYQDTESISQIRSIVDFVNETQEGALHDKTTGECLDLSDSDKKLIKEQLACLFNLTLELNNRYCHKMQTIL